MGDADDSYDFSRARAVRREAARGLSAGDGQPLQGRHPAGRHAGAAPLSRQPGAELHRAAFLPCRGAATSIAGCAASTATRCAALELKTPRHGVRERAGGEGGARRAGASPRCRRRCTRTAAAGRRTCGAGATAGATCASCCCSARAGCSCTRDWRCSALGSALTTALYFTPLHVLGAGLDIHSMLYASAGALLGLQLCLFALFARVSAQNAGLLPPQPALDRLLRVAYARARTAPGPRRSPWPASCGARPPSGSGARRASARSTRAW